jgi:hypothetical protein
MDQTIVLNEQRERQRKFLLFLPLLILPFLALAFWALGGGRSAQVTTVTAQKGINTDLPEAQLDEAPQTKLSLYDRMEKDSLRNTGHDPLGALTKDSLHSAASQSAAANETAIDDRLNRIRQQLAQPPAPSPGSNPVGATNNAEVERLEKMMQVLKNKPGADPQMEQLSQMLDKIVAIQNPGVIKPAVPLNPVRDSAFQAIPALIDGKQKVAPGAAVSLVLRDSVRLNGTLFPKGQKLSGLCSVTNQRLLLDIRNIRLGTSIIPVSLTVYSLDGLQGIPAPEAELNEAAGNGAGNALSGMQFLSMDQGLGAQAATAGISAATGLLSKKVKKIRVKLHGGQMVLLRVNKP